MPELPEVETIRLGLSPKITGLHIKSIQILNPKSFAGDAQLVLKTPIERVWRKAKVLGIEFANGWNMLVHLKMTGQLIFVGEGSFAGGHPTRDMLGEMPNKSTRVIIEFANGAQLFFNDQRKFGWMKLIMGEDISSHAFLKSVGPEPLELEFTEEVFAANLLRHKSMAVKVAILDQKVVAGVGNIYACEACFIAKIHPSRKVSSLTFDELKRLHQGIIDALQTSIAHGGSSKTHYVNESGEKGRFLDFAYVNDRGDQPCKVCGRPIKKITLGGRGTYFCDYCQK